MQLQNDTHGDLFYKFKSYIMQDKIDGLILKGPGGDLDAGYAIADVVLKFSLNITVPENTECASACSLIYSAGKKRTLDNGASLGFHLPFARLESNEVATYCYSLTTKESSKTNQNSPLANLFNPISNQALCLERTYQKGLLDIRKLQKYLDRDGISSEVLDIVINTPSAQMTWIKKERAADKIMDLIVESRKDGVEGLDSYNIVHTHEEQLLVVNEWASMDDFMNYVNGPHNMIELIEHLCERFDEENVCKAYSGTIRYQHKQ